MIYLKRNSFMLLILFCLLTLEAGAQPCREKMDKVRAELTLLVLSEDNLTLRYKHLTFDSTKDTVVAELRLLSNCAEYASLKKFMTDVINSVGKVNLKSKLPDLRASYGDFSRKRDVLLSELNKLETASLVRSIHEELIKHDSAENKHYEILTTQSKTILDTLDYHSPLYTGINWFTQNAVGFGVHYHFMHSDLFSPLAGITLVYQWQLPENDQESATNNFGVTLSGGFSVRLSQHNRIGIMADAAIIDDELNAGARLMAYNQHFAVGMGYNEYMGADITLMIRFHNPKK